MATSGERFEDTWEFQAGDVVPIWLFQTSGLKSLTFTTRTTVFADLQGQMWVMPHICIHSDDGFGAFTAELVDPDMPAACIGRGPTMVLDEPFLQLPFFA